MRKLLYLYHCLSSGCFNELSLAGWLINNRNLLLTVLEASSPRAGAACCVPVRALLQGTHFSFSPYMAKRGQGSSQGSPCIGVLILRAPLSWPNRLPKAPPPITITLSIRISTYEFGAGHKQSTATIYTTHSIRQLRSRKSSNFSFQLLS